MCIVYATHTILRESLKIELILLFQPFDTIIWARRRYHSARPLTRLDIQCSRECTLQRIYSGYRICTDPSVCVLCATTTAHKYTQIGRVRCIFIVTKCNLVVAGFDTSVPTIYWYSLVRLRCVRWTAVVDCPHISHIDFISMRFIFFRFIVIWVVFSGFDGNVDGNGGGVFVVVVL